MQHAFRGSTRLFAFLSASVLVSAAFAAGASAHGVARHKGHHGSGHSHSNGGVTITSHPWGTVPGEGPANLYTLANSKGMKVNITNYGGVVQSIWVPAKKGGTRNVALGFSNLSDYVNDFTQGANQTSWPLPGGSGDTYFGAIIGRYANRIANATFDLNGQTYKLDANNGTNTLHGGYLGWNTVVWTASQVSKPGAVGLQLTHDFPAGEGCDAALSPGCNGFPSTVSATVTYWLDNSNALSIQYAAKNTGSDSTVINLTNHTYFNLGGEGSGTVYHQDLQLNSDQYQPVNTNLIPSAPYFVNVKGTAYDFTHLHAIGQNIRNTNLPDGGGQPFKQLQIAHGYDNNWVLNGYAPGKVNWAATALDSKTGIELQAFTDQPGVQVYTGNFLVGDLIGTSGNVYRQGDAFTLETQHYPDAPHHIGDAQWPSVVLDAGQTFNSTTAFKFSVTGGHGGRSSHKKH